VYNDIILPFYLILLLSNYSKNPEKKITGYKKKKNSTKILNDFWGIMWHYKDWSNDPENAALITEINYILLYTHTHTHTHIYNKER